MDLTLLVAIVLSAIGGGVFSYLFLRANPKKKAAVDKFVDENKV